MKSEFVVDADGDTVAIRPRAIGRRLNTHYRNPRPKPRPPRN